MPVVTLPDERQIVFDHSPSVSEVAGAIGPRLQAQAIAGLVDGILVDVSHIIEQDSKIQIIVSDDEQGLEILRHSCAHLMAHAVKTLYPEAQVTIGPVIADGFYYDYSCDHRFTPDDLIKIEEKMYELAKEDYPVQRKTMSRDEAIEFFEAHGETYKVDIIKDIPEGELLSFYSQGDFTDLCRGPHVPSTKHLKAFKLIKLAGAYWRGDSNNPMLQRIYGTAWPNKKALKQYLILQEEAQKRDHRKIAKKQDLFHFQEEAPGMIFWHPKGWRLYQIIQAYLSAKMRTHGYFEINTPAIVGRRLWEKSGHWDKFQQEMFTTHSEERDYAIKPMNCPCHIQVFNQGTKSYRDLPLRFAEFGSCYRNEPSGTLHGLLRARNFTQDDAHIFCTEEQIQVEVAKFIEMLFSVYQDFGFEDVIVKLSTRPPKRVGDDSVWDKAEKALQLALEEQQLDWELQPGEGAFYGPKIEFSLKDCLKRVWQCGTIQIDFSMPERLGASYIDANNQKQVPVMLHRAILGSIERFIGILIEHYSGALPFWLAPIQIVVITITDRQDDYAKNIYEMLQKHLFRVILDLRNEKIGLKIREHTIQGIPYHIIIGDRELQNEEVTIRERRGKDLGAMPMMKAIDYFNNITNKN